MEHREISLEEDEEENQIDNCSHNYYSNKKYSYFSQKKNNENNGGSLLGIILNSFSKIGQGIKNIMTMKMNFDEDENPNIYYQSQSKNKFNNENSNLNEPMEVSHDFNSSMYKNLPQDKNHKYSFSFDNKLDIDFNKKHFKDIIKNNKKILIEEEINTDLPKVKNNIIKDTKYKDEESIKEKKMDISSSLLTHKRKKEEKIEDLLSEEENPKEKSYQNDVEIQENIEESLVGDLSKNHKNNITNIKSINNNTNNSIMQNNINSSIMSISFKSLDDIKSEISQKKKEHIKNVDKLFNRQPFFYNYEKELEIRKKILDEYYKNKAQKIADFNEHIEKEKKKREEEYKKLKIKKEKELKYHSFKKPVIFKKTESSVVEFIGKQEIKSNNNPLDITFGKINQGNTEKKNKEPEAKQSEQNKLFSEVKKSEISFVGNSLFNVPSKNVEEKGSNEEKKDNKKESIFSSLINNNKSNEIKEENTEKKQDNNKNEGFLLFSKSSTDKGLFSGGIGSSTSGSLFGNKEPEKKENEEPKNNALPIGSLFSSQSNNTENKNSLFAPKQNKTNEEQTKEKPKIEGGLFGNLVGDNKSSSNDGGFFNDNNKEKNGLFGNIENKEKSSLFNQETKVSSSIKNDSLFKSNQNETNFSDEKGLLLNKNNPFLANAKANKTNQVNIFQSPTKNNNSNTQNNTQTKSLFGNTNNTGGQQSLFGANNNNNNQQSLFGVNNNNNQSTSLFGDNKTSTSLLGTNNNQSTSLFGAINNKTASFGTINNNTQGSLFGFNNNSSNNQGSLFGNSSPQFTFGK